MRDNSLVPPKQRALLLIWLMMFVAYLDRANITVAGPELSRALHMNHTQFGFALSAFTLGYALMQIPGGRLADRFGARPLLVIALLVWSAFTALTGLVRSAFSLFAVRILFGLGEGLENGAQFKLIGDYFSSQERSSANAFFLTALALGPALAVPAATAMLAHAGWRAIFLWFSLPGLLVALLLFLLLPSPPAEAAQAEASDNAGSDDAEAENRAYLQIPTWLAFFAYLLFNIAFWGFLGWMPTYLSEARHIKLSSLGRAAQIPYWSGFVGMLLLGWLGSRPMASRRAMLVGASYLLAAAFFYFTCLTKTADLSVAGLSCAAFFLYGGFGPFWAVAIDLAPATRRGTLTGFVNFGGQIGGFCAPILVGKIVDITHGFTGGFLLMTGALVLAAGCLFWLQKAAPAGLPVTPGG